MGFFTSKELSKNAEIKVATDQLEPNCIQCGLYKNCITSKMSISGEGRKKILIIGEYPSETEDEYGVQFVGDSGDILKEKLKYLDISLNRDCWKINAVTCKPPENREPSHKEIKFCYPLIEKAIRELKPDLIIPLGSIAITSILGEDFSDRSVLRWRGFQIPDEKFKCFIVPTFHPSELAKNEFDRNLASTFERDLKKAKACLKRDYIEQFEHEQYVTVLKDFKKVKSLLERIIQRKSKIVYDYETTGLKPYRKGHKIVTIAIGVSPKKAFAFPFNYKSFWTQEEFKILHNLWKKILDDRRIKKIAHNHKFENVWDRVIMGVNTKGWYWDPMMAEHIIDNRSRSTGLKFQTYVKHGVRPYNKHIEKFLDSGKEEFNTIEKAPFNELLLYNGLDCIYTWWIYEEEKHKFSGMKGLSRAFGFFMKGLSTMAEIQHNGINADMAYYKKTKIELEKRIEDLQKYLTEGREAKKFRKRYGRAIKITSNHDLGKLFFEVLGKTPIYTAAGNYKTDKATLEALNLPFVDKLLEMKRLEKARGTYLGQFAREVYKGKMHPFFDLHIPKTYRSSSSRPNFQNLPKRDPEIGNIVRKGLIPSPNSVICEADFSGAEVITSLCYHHDKNFYNYLVDPTTDMHRDNASDLLILDSGMLDNSSFTDEQKKLAKMIRFYAKNNWTFAEFYGDWFASCGETFWENVVEAGLKLPNGVTARAWLEEKGIFELGEMSHMGPTPGSFLEHCKAVERKMWYERFPEYTQWKKDINEFYQKYGYIETFFGFRFTGYMDRKQCSNYPIQGTSFHLLVYTLIEIDKFIKRNNLKTRLIGQVHDSVISDVHKDELKFYLNGVRDIVASLQDKFKWLIIPMEIEAEISRLREDGGNFAEMKEVDINEPIIW